MSVVKKKHVSAIITFLTLFLVADTIHAWPSNTRNDPYPMYTSIDPEYFLQGREKLLIKGFPDEKGTPEILMISLSPFGQNAQSAKTLAGTYCQLNKDQLGTCQSTEITQPLCDTSSLPNCTNEIQIGDIDGRWNLLGLLAGPFPQNFNLGSAPLLEQAFSALFPNTQPGTITANQIQTSAQPNPYINTAGYVSVPLKYRKRGIRWDVEAQICGDFGLQFQGGIVEITQVLNPSFINLNSGAISTCSGQPISQEAFNCNLFDPLVQIAQELGLNICNFTKWGFEDMFLSLYWRHAHVVNFNRDLSWARFLAIPFVRFGAGIATGRPKDPAVVFSVPFGNNGSNSININAGMNFDFVETIEIGAEVGYSHFFGRDFNNYRMPTNELQSGIYPFATSANVQPGPSAYVAAKMSAYHFLDRLSFYFQYVFVHHRKDHIRLLVDDPVFDVTKCPNTAFRVQLGNIAFNYDISPTISLGFLWQQMFHVRNAYNSNTVMFNLNIIF